MFKLIGVEVQKEKDRKMEQPAHKEQKITLELIWLQKEAMGCGREL